MLRNAIFDLPRPSNQMIFTVSKSHNQSKHLKTSLVFKCHLKYWTQKVQISDNSRIQVSVIQIITVSESVVSYH